MASRDVGEQREWLGPLRLREKLGEGGTSEVFLAHRGSDAGSSSEVAVKRMHARFTQSGLHRANFLREAEMAMGIVHPNVVRVFAVEARSQVDVPYMEMELVDGVDLARILAAKRRENAFVSVEIAAFVTLEIASALEHVHHRVDARGEPWSIVHGDISPRNVLVSKCGDVKLTDFGSARTSRLDGPADAVQGTIGHASPEQARGEPLDPRSDLFSLGTVLYALLTGVAPFAGPTRAETLRRLNAGEYPPLERLRPDVPRAFSRVLAKMIASEPEARFVQASALREAVLDAVPRAAEAKASLGALAVRGAHSGTA
jgi:serine/threonine protein kinase